MHTSGEKSDAELNDKSVFINNILNATVDIIGVINNEGKRIFANAATYEILGYSPDELIGNSVFDLVHEDDKLQTSAVLKTIRSQKIITNFENRLLHKNGTVKSMSWTLRWEEATEFIYLTGRDITANKLMTTALAESQKRFEAYIENATDALFIHDIEGHFTDVNRRACESLGYTKEELLQMTVMDIDSSLDMPLVREAWQKVKQESETTLISTNRRKDGVVFPVEIRFSKFEMGGKPYIMGFVRDISARKIADEQLKDSEKRFRSIIENLNVGILKYNAEKEIMIWNHTALRLLGVSADQIQHKTPFDTGWKAVYEDGTDIPYQSYPHFKAIDTLQPVKNVIMGIYRPRNNDSVWVLVNATPQFFDDGSLECVTVTFADITEKKKMEAELNAQFKRYKMLMHTSQDFIQILNREGKLLEWNEAFEKHLGYSEEELVPMHAWDWSPAFTREQVIKILSEVKDEGISFEAQHLLKDGSVRSVDVKLHKFSSEGEAFFYASARDITELKNRQWEIEHLNEELRGLSVHIQNVIEQERATLAKEIHDEFGQTFVAISMNAELIKQKVKDKTEQLTELLNEQIELSHKVIVASRMLFNTLYPTMLDDMGLVTAMESYFESSSQKFSVLKFEMNTNIRDEVLAKDISLVLYRIFQECMTNISLYAKATQVCTDLYSDGENIVMRITDNGTGFDVNAVDTKEHHGLLVMRERTLAIDGKFSVVSVPQKGTTIEVVIPVIRRQSNEFFF